MNVATPTIDGRDPTLATLAENVRTASSIVHDTITVRDLRKLRNRVANIRATTREIREFTDVVAQRWDQFTPEQKRELYRMATEISTPRSEPHGPPTSLAVTFTILLFRRPLKGTIDEAEEALFWFADEILDQVESEAPEVQAMLAEHLEAARTDAKIDEHRHVVR